jgi:rRNA processing protein Gar1
LCQALTPSAEIGSFIHPVESEMLCSLTNPQTIPYFNAPIYLENKTQIGKIDEILGPINEVYFTVKMEGGMVASSFKKEDKVFIGGDKLLPIERFLPKPKIAGAKVESEFCLSSQCACLTVQSEAADEVDEEPEVDRVVEGVPEEEARREVEVVSAVVTEDEEVSVVDEVDSVVDEERPEVEVLREAGVDTDLHFCLRFISAEEQSRW